MELDDKETSILSDRDTESSEYTQEVEPFVERIKAILNSLNQRFSSSHGPFVQRLILKGIAYNVFISPTTGGFSVSLTKDSQRPSPFPGRVEMVLTNFYYLRIADDQKYVSMHRGDQPLQPYCSTTPEQIPVLKDVRRWCDVFVEALSQQLSIQK